MAMSGIKSSPYPRDQPIQMAVDKSFSNKTLLVTGCSGFLGKVWLSMFVKHIPDFSHLYLIIRAKGNQSSQERFKNMIHESFAFKPWHDDASFEGIARLLNEKVTILDGDISKDHLGLSAFTAQKIKAEVDLVLNISGLVDFRASLALAYHVNVMGIQNIAQFVAESARGKLVHVSTCYVAGKKEGAMLEQINDRTPINEIMDPDKEIKWIENAISNTQKKFETKDKTQELQSILRKRLEAKNRKPNIKQFQRSLDHLKQTQLTQALVQLGSDRAEAMGYPNTYAYTKDLGENLLAKHFSNVDFTIARPAIVESALAYPFPGWNEGFNTSGPLVYLVKGWFRYFPSEEDHPFDVIPVDIVAKGLTLIAAAKLKGQAKQVYQLCSSYLNTFTMGDACRLSSNYYDQFYKKTGKTFFERHFQHRKTIATVREHILSSKNLYAFFASLDKRFASVDELPLFIQNQLKPLRMKIALIKRKMEHTEVLLKIFKPYIHDFVQIYISKNILQLQPEEPFWHFDIETLDWETYWSQAQMPGLQTWCFPAIEGKVVPKMKPAKSFIHAPMLESVEELV